MTEAMDPRGDSPQEMLDDMLDMADVREIPLPEEETPPAEPDAEQLKAALKAAADLHEEDLNRIARAQADFENFRRRNESIRADSYEEGRRGVIAAMLPVKDNLERALDAAPEESALRTGVELTLRQLNAAFEKLGVAEINRLGEVFDPNLEEAVLRAEPDEGEPGTVCQVLQKGYQLGGTVIRHAMVKVVGE